MPGHDNSLLSLLNYEDPNNNNNDQLIENELLNLLQKEEEQYGPYGLTTTPGLNIDPSREREEVVTLSKDQPGLLSNFLSKLIYDEDLTRYERGVDM